MDGAARLRVIESLQVFLQAVRHRRVWRETNRLLLLLGGIADPDIRLHRFGEHLRRQMPDEAAWTLAGLWDRLALGERSARQVGLGLLDAKRLAQVVGADQLNEVQAVLEARGHACAGLFRAEGPRHGTEGVGHLPRPREPVGFRISLARRAAASALDRLVFDPDAGVVRTLLTNPRLVEADVVKLAASRRATAEVLEVIAQHERWIVRYPVKVALANNPVSPLRVVLGLLPYLLQQDLKAIAADSPRAEVREQASRLLSQRQEP